MQRATTFCNNIKHLDYNLHHEQHCAAITRLGTTRHVLPGKIHEPSYCKHCSCEAKAEGKDKGKVDYYHGYAVGYDGRQQEQCIDEEANAVPLESPKGANFETDKHTCTGCDNTTMMDGIKKLNK